ncbi:MAG TPA: hypothetical protein VF407_04975 [Polyangiaceae bacterium]
MRSSSLPALALAVFVLLPACKKLEEKAEDRALGTVETKAAGVSYVAKVCDGWPATVPVYPGATQIHCLTADSDKSKASALGRFIAAGSTTTSNPAPEPPDLTNVISMTLTFHADADRAKVTAFYAGKLPYDPVEGTTSSFANHGHPNDPVKTVQILPDPADPSAIAVEVTAEPPHGASQ